MSFEKWVQEWTRTELEHFAKGNKPDGDSLEEQVHLLQYDQWNARMAQALIQSGEVHPLFQARTHLFRGNLQEAETSLHLLSEQIQAVDGKEETAGIRSEYLLEQARLAGYQGAWGEMIALASEALVLTKNPITRLSLLECRALGLYETGSFQASIKDLEQIDSLGRVYRYSINVLYAESIMIRILARSGRVDLAIKKLQSLWKSYEKNHSLDTVLTLLRLETDLARVRKKGHLTKALASYLVSDAIGDSLYRGLALAEIFCSSEPAFLNLRKGTEDPDLKFQRVLSLFEEILGSPKTSTGSELYHFRLNTKTTSSFQDHDFTAIKHLVLIEQGIVMNLPESRVYQVKVEKQHKQALEILFKGPIEKEEFFNKVWGFNFVKEIHDSALRSLLYRIRKLYEIPIESKDGLITLMNTWIALEEL